MEGIELISFQIISFVGSAKSSYIEAIQCAKDGYFEKAKQKMQEGTDSFLLGHNIHANLIRKFANGEVIEFNLLLMHAEDQLMSAETIRLFAEEFLDLFMEIKGGK